MTPYPGDEQLVPNHGGRDPESQDVANTLRGRRWDEVPLEVLRARAESLPLLTPAAFRYYLPTFMLGVVNHYNEVDVAGDSVLFNLTPPNTRTGWRWDFFRTRAEQFTTHERTAIARFLQFMDERYRSDWANSGIEPPEDRVGPALRYWGSL